MNSRRAFLMKGTLATAAIVASNTLKSLASTIVPVTEFAGFDKKLVLLHTAYLHPGLSQQSFNKINSFRKKRDNVLLVDTGNNPVGLPFDVHNLKEDNLTGTYNNYQVIYKGNIKIGIINLNSNIYNAPKEVNRLSRKLKEDDQCSLVIYISQLGFKNKHGIDELKFASRSTHVDIIISSHKANYCKNPYIARNKNNDEVIINASASNGLNFGNIEVGFDRNDMKNFVAINNLQPALSA